MRKVLALILCLLMLPLALCRAEGALYDGDIQFAGLSYGATFGEVRASNYVRSIEFNRYPRPTRMIGDSAGRYVNMYGEYPDPQGFSARMEGRQVAGHQAEVEAYFTYQTENGPVTEDNRAILYAGAYIFYEEEGQRVFDDLRGKLTSLYGEPFAEGTSLDCWGELETPEDKEWAKNDYAEAMDRTHGTYVMWQSVSGAQVVLKLSAPYGDMFYAEVDYLFPQADEAILSASQESAAASGSTDGL